MTQSDLEITLKCEELARLLACLERSPQCEELALPLRRLVGFLNETGTVVLRGVPERKP